MNEALDGLEAKCQRTSVWKEERKKKKEGRKEEEKRKRKALMCPVEAG